MHCMSLLAAAVALLAFFAVDPAAATGYADFRLAVVNCDDKPVHNAQISTQDCGFALTKTTDDSGLAYVNSNGHQSFFDWCWANTNNRCWWKATKDGQAFYPVDQKTGACDIWGQHGRTLTLKPSWCPPKHECMCPCECTAAHSPPPANIPTPITNSTSPPPPAFNGTINGTTNATINGTTNGTTINGTTTNSTSIFGRHRFLFF